MASATAASATDRRLTGGSLGGSRRDLSSASGGGGALAPPAPGLVAPLGDAQALSDMLTSSYFNVLLVCVPLGWAASCLGWGSVPVFFFNFTSLIPLALVLGQLTEDLALRYGEKSLEMGKAPKAIHRSARSILAFSFFFFLGIEIDISSSSPLSFFFPLQKNSNTKPKSKATPSAASSTPLSATSSR